MTSNHRSKTILVLTVYVCVLLIAITATLSPLWAQTSAPSSLSRSVAPSLPLSRADIQAAPDLKPTPITPLVSRLSSLTAHLSKSS